VDILYDFHPFVYGGSPEKGFFSAALPLKTPPSELLSTHGRVFGLFTINYPEIFPLETLSKEILPYFEQLYYERECSSPHAHLIQSATDTQSYLEKRILEVNGVDNVDFSCIFGCVWGSVLYLVRCGGASALRLYRDDTFGLLFDVNASSGSTALSSLSGFIKPGDLIVLCDSSVDSTEFPLSTTTLSQIDKQVVYTKLTQMFDLGTQKNNVGSVSGFYILADLVPSSDEDGLLFADVQDETDLDQTLQTSDEAGVSPESVLNEPRGELPVETQEASGIKSSVAQRLLQRAAFSKGVPSRFFSRLQFSNQSFFFRLKRFLSFFTKSRVFLIGCMFLVLFTGFIIAGKDYEKSFKVEKELSALKIELLPKIEEAYKQGQYYAELNPERAKKYLQDAQGFLSQFGSEGRADQDVAKSIRAIGDAYAIVTKTYLLDEITPFFDLTTVNQGARGTRASLVSSSLVVSDSQQNAVYKIGTETKSAVSIIGQEDISGLISAEGEPGNVYAVGSQSIVKAVENDARVVKMKEAGGEWGSIVDMQVYGSSVYLLDKSKNQVWKYIPEGNAFGSVRNYISSDSEVELEKAVSMAIDGNVWIGLSDGEVIKLFSGKKDVYSLGPLDVPLSSLTAIYTDDASEYLYVLEQSVGRVVVFSKKDGSYVSTYQSDKFKGGQDLVVDTKKGHLYVLRDSLIYRVELREKTGQVDL